MKKTYINPEMMIVELCAPQLLAGSGPGAGDQPNPGIGGGSAPLFDEPLPDDFFESPEELLGGLY